MTLSPAALCGMEILIPSLQKEQAKPSDHLQPVSFHSPTRSMGKPGASPAGQCLNNDVLSLHPTWVPIQPIRTVAPVGADGSD